MYRIGEFSKKVNISIKTLRYYDEINLFKPSYIDNDTNYRYYEEKQIKDILYINSLKKLDLSLNEIKEFLNNNNDILYNKKEKLEESIENINNYINNHAYTVKLESKGKYFLYYGSKQKNSYLGKCIENNTAKYYIIYKDNNYFCDATIYDEDNSIIISKNKIYEIKEIIYKLFETINNKKITIFFNLGISDEGLNTIYNLYNNVKIYDDRIEVIKDGSN